MLFCVAYRRACRRRRSVLLQPHCKSGAEVWERRTCNIYMALKVQFNWKSSPQRTSPVSFTLWHLFWNLVSAGMVQHPVQSGIACQWGHFCPLMVQWPRYKHLSNMQCLNFSCVQIFYPASHISLNVGHGPVTTAPTRIHRWGSIRGTKRRVATSICAALA